MTIVSLNVLDELYLHLDRAEEPWSVQREVGVEGRVEDERLASALEQAARRHPHAAGDGMSAVRLMVSILRAYAGLTEDLAAVDPLAVRDIGELVGSRSLGPRLARGRALVERTARAASSPVRIAADGGDAGRASYGFELLRLGREEL